MWCHNGVTTEGIAVVWHAVVVHSPNEPTCLLFWMLCSHSVAVNCPTIGYLYFVFLVVHRDLSVAFARATAGPVAPDAGAAAAASAPGAAAS